MLTKLAVTAAAVIALSGSAITASAAASPHGRTEHGCPYGAVCLYPGMSFNAKPAKNEIFFSYGAHNLHHQYGMHVGINNQYDGAGFAMCTKSNGKGMALTSDPDRGRFAFNLSPVNSVTLFYRQGDAGSYCGERP